MKIRYCMKISSSTEGKLVRDKFKTQALGYQYLGQFTHKLASLTSWPPFEEQDFMVGRYSPLTAQAGYLPTTSGNGFTSLKQL
jgi:hypothetical protein